MSVMVVVRIVETENPAIVALVNCVVDVGQVVPGHHGLTVIDIPPNRYATQNRQDAVKALAPQCDVVIVVGSPTSSNSNRLREVAENLGVPAFMVDSADEIQAEWMAGISRVGLTAGASAPEILVGAVIERLKQLGVDSVADLEGVREKVEFPLPKGLG